MVHGLHDIEAFEEVITSVLCASQSASECFDGVVGCVQGGFFAVVR